MFLKQIKIIGFKSFVESTIIEFRSDRVAIVGPNGCGKSNIIDAIRWVMGESSPKFLRGDLMADVIFNGSMHRKPMGLASVEIILDNTQNFLQGAYVKKGDVSLRREVNRSGESSYFINQQRVRRKDLSDLWLGTGAGARGYAIIGQNMVNQLVEANPEALKAYLEEAAGVSKYKERRKESATRLASIHENVARISDIVAELSIQLERLEREANDAKQYHLLKQSLKEQECFLQYAKYNAVLQKQVHLDQRHTKELTQQNELAEQILFQDMQLKDLDNLILSQQEQVQIGEQELYKLQMDLSQQEHLFVKREQDKSRYTSEKNVLLEETNHLQKEKTDQTALLNELIQKQLLSQTAQDELNQQLQSQSNTYEEQERILKHLYTQKHETKQELQNLETQIKVMNVKLEQAQDNIERYKIEMQNARLNEYAHEIALIEQELQQLNLNLEHGLLEKQDKQEAYHALQRQVEIESSALAEAQIALKALEKQYQHMHKELLSAQASYEGLLASMQQTSSDIGKEQLKQWLQTWQVPAIWQGVVDFLWQHFLPHGLVDVFEPNHPTGIYLARLKQLALDDPGNLLVFFGVNEEPNGFFKWSDLKVVNTSEEALLLRESLKQHESIITADGLWIGFDWQYQLSFEQQGLASRLQLYKNLQVTFQELENSYHKATQAFECQQKHHQKLLLAIQELDTVQKNLLVNLEALNQKKSHLEQKHLFFQQEQMKKNQSIHSLEASYVEASQLFNKCLVISDECQVKQKAEASTLYEIMNSIQFHKSNHEKLMDTHRVLQQKRDDFKEDLFRIKTQVDLLQQELPKLDKRIVVAQGRLSQVDEALQGLVDDNLWSPERILSKKALLQTKEEMLATARMTLKNAQTQKQKQQSSFDDLKKQEILLLEKKWRIEAEKEQLEQERKELEQSFLSVAAALPWKELKNHEDEPYFRKKIMITEQALLVLGDVNLLALGLYDEERLRFESLLAQQQDLQHAMQELEQAIATLDLDMQVRLETTLKSINEHLLDIFPQLFGGGQAKFVASCDNLLEATVAVHVQLPGKKQHRIQLLSGGEKALTAVALLFAIFSLNPAPFCLLDEVDAALDDANVQRLANLIKKLSDKVQFVLITHNPLTMDAADDLVGVTMQEAGVSRVVSVNMAKALEMVNKE